MAGRGELSFLGGSLWFCAQPYSQCLYQCSFYASDRRFLPFKWAASTFLRSRLWR